MSKQKRKGTAFERQVVDYMSAVLQDTRIERRAQEGVNDRGDVSGVMLRGKPVVIECKNHARMELSKWLDEAEAERGNADAEFAFVAHKRRGCGEKNMGDTYVTCTLDTLCAVIAGSRRLLYYTAEERDNGRLMLRERGIDEDG